ncbi:Exocyst complex component 3-like protein 4 [Varanus komodoensis]|nr:Exocyst complex component 3-like protein 4 [Varanus komodoensis]
MRQTLRTKSVGIFRKCHLHENGRRDMLDLTTGPAEAKETMAKQSHKDIRLLDQTKSPSRLTFCSYGGQKGCNSIPPMVPMVDLTRVLSVANQMTLGSPRAQDECNDPFTHAIPRNWYSEVMGLQENLKVSCKELEKTLDNEMLEWRKYFLNKLRLKTKPMFKKILSQEWILSGATLDSVIMRMLLVVEEFFKQLSHLKSSMCTDFLNEVHKYVVKEYITQTLKSKGRIKPGKRKDISKIMAQDATAIHNTMRHLGSSFNWLQLAIPYIATIIGEKKKNKIKDYIASLSDSYPDIRKEHILAILALRGLSRNKRNSIVDCMAMEELQVERNRTLFAEIELQTTVQCF